MSLSVSTSAISTASAALRILKRPSPLDAINIDPSMSPMDRLTAIVNAVSSEDSPAKTDAASKITSSLLDQQESADNIVARALKLFDSDTVKTSDPKIKEILKGVIEKNSSEFAMFYRQQLAKTPGVSDDNAMVNAMTSMITRHRDLFGDDEFIFGAKLANGGVVLTNISDKSGKSTSATLSERRCELNAQIRDIYKSLWSGNEIADSEAILKEKQAALSEIEHAQIDYWDGWRKAFGIRV